MKSTLLFLLVLVLLGFLVGCNYDNPASITTENQTDQSIRSTDTIKLPLLRSNLSSMGTVRIYNDYEKVYFRITANTGYRLTKIRTHAKEYVWSFPLTNNCPNTSAFNLQVNTLPPNTTTYLQSINKYRYGSRNYYVYAAIYVEGEAVSNEPDCITAWASGTNFPGCTGEGKHFSYWVY
jgi:hypothetical protein